jgi:hypothetical protein
MTSKYSQCLVFISVLSTLIFTPANANDTLDVVPDYLLNSHIRLNFFNVAMPHASTVENSNSYDLDDTMGLAGLHYQLDITPNFYTGVAMYAAVTGDQGGLFTLGAEVGARYPLTESIQLDANVHFGGGGGYRYLINDGSYLNTNAGLAYKFSNFNLGVQHSYLNFYSGSIEDHSVSAYIEVPLTLHYSDYGFAHQRFKRLTSNQSWSHSSHKNAFQLRFDYLFPFAGSKNDRNHNESPLRNTLHVLGFEYQHFITERAFAFVHTDAIYKGLTAGFMDLFVGAGYQPIQSHYFNVFTKLALGAAGGRIAPEGGLTIYPSIGTEFRVAEDVWISNHVGYFRALDGDFETFSAGAGIKYALDAQNLATASTLVSTGLSVHLNNQTYQQAPRMRQAPIDLQLLVVQINYDLNKWFYAAGQAAFAYKGESGGYADGMAGLGAYSPSIFNQDLRLNTELLIGAGGGGGIDTSEGIVIKPKMGINYHIGKGISANAALGKIISPQGALDSLNYSIGLSFSAALMSE